MCVWKIAWLLLRVQINTQRKEGELSRNEESITRQKKDRAKNKFVKKCRNTLYILMGIFNFIYIVVIITREILSTILEDPL